MRRIGIIGAGQSGLQLGIGLRKAGYEVVLVSNQSAEQILSGRVSSSQCMFASALGHERELGIHFWEQDCPGIEEIQLTIASPEHQKALQWAGRLDAPAMSVDQRIKMPRWMAELSRLGGEIRIQNAGVAEIEQLARECELVVVAAGKGEITRVFERDATRSAFNEPMRALALTYVKGMRPRPDRAAVCFNVIPGVGEYFVFPALTTVGACEIMVFEGIPGGPMDCWSDVRSPEQHLEVSRSILQRYLPWEHERTSSIELTDANGVLAGRFAPTVRHPVARLPSGAIVLGMADVVCVNDPITGQGSNNASKCAATYLQAILQAEDRPYDVEWMRKTFDTYWNYARFVTDWTNRTLLPPPAHVLALMGAAAAKPRIANWFANGFDDPRRFFPQYAEPEAAHRFIEEFP